MMNFIKKFQKTTTKGFFVYIFSAIFLMQALKEILLISMLSSALIVVLIACMIAGGIAHAQRENNNR